MAAPTNSVRLFNQHRRLSVTAELERTLLPAAFIPANAFIKYVFLTSSLISCYEAIFHTSSIALSTMTKRARQSQNESSRKKRRQEPERPEAAAELPSPESHNDSVRSHSPILPRRLSCAVFREGQEVRQWTYDRYSIK